MTGNGSGLVLLIGAAAAGATTLGGIVALRFRALLGLLLCFSSGAVLGVALFDLLPEALSLAPKGQSFLEITTAVACGFLVYLVLDRIASGLAGTSPSVGAHLGPAGFAIHSLIDGLGIGMALHASPAAGLVVAFAVVAHDVVDGANTVTLSLAGRTSATAAKTWLAVDALAPLVGLALAQLAWIPLPLLSLLLATVCGGFTYIGACELLPRTRAVRALPALGLCAAGMAVIYAVVRLTPS